MLGCNQVLVEKRPEKRVKQTDIRRKGKQSETPEGKHNVALANPLKGFMLPNSDLFCFVSSILARFLFSFFIIN